MSHLLWGVGQLIDEPSSTLINTLQKYFFNTHCDITVNTDYDEDRLKNSDTKRDVIIKTDSKKSNKSIKSYPILRSKQVQVGSGITRRRPVSIQCSKISKEVIDKATNTTQAVRLDKYIGTSKIIINKINAETCTSGQKVCDEHLKVFEILKQWSVTEIPVTTNNIKTNKFVQLKAKLIEFIKTLKVNKIESLRRYKKGEEQFIKLYKCSSAN